MVVRNIYVSDKEYFLEFLIRYLIKYGISYCLVKEADEVHFDNYIIRFHTKVNETDNLDDLLRTLMEIESNTRDFFISENENNNTDYSDKRLYPKMNKKLIKKLIIPSITIIVMILLSKVFIKFDYTFISSAISLLIHGILGVIIYLIIVYKNNAIDETLGNEFIDKILIKLRLKKV